jgi:hypothetical protein
VTDHDHEADERYELGPVDQSILAAGKELLWKIARSPLVGPVELEVVANAMKILDRMPEVSPDADILIQLSGPRRWFGEHETWHWWEIRFQGQAVRLGSGGHFYRKSTGGDSFTSMQWSAYPGYEAEHIDYLEHLKIVDDAQPFDAEVAQINLQDAGYTLTVTRDGEQVGESDYDEEDEAVADEGTPAVPPADESERRLEDQVDFPRAMSEGQHSEPPPTKCDLCGCDLTVRKFLIDGRLRGGLTWANMCSNCFFQRAQGLGWGNGQLYQRQTDGRWLLVAGFQPDE